MGAPPPQTLLLERDDEVALLSRCIERAARGDGTTIAIEAQAGVGKSALLAYGARLAATAGLSVMRACGGELERDFAYGVVRQLFEARLATARSEERERLLAGAAALAAPIVLAGDGGRAIRGDPAPVVRHGLYWLTANIAEERPLLIAIDDAHWADAPSIAFVSYLARRTAGLPILLMYASRPHEGNADLLAAAAGPQVSDGCRLRPCELSAAATTELLEWLLGAACSPALAAACNIASAGNPFLLHELARTLHVDGAVRDDGAPGRIAQLAPPAIRQATIARLLRLGPATTELAFAVAVLGSQAQLRHAAALADLSIDEASAAADALASAAILGNARPLRFIHPVVRTAVYTDIPRSRRCRQHRRAAQLLDADGERPDAIAPHLLAAEPAADPWVVEQLRGAARMAFERGAADSACTYLERALAEPPSGRTRDSVLRELGMAELRAARSSAATTLRAAYDAAPDDAGPEDVTALAVALLADGRAAEGAAFLERLIARLDGVDRDAVLRLEALLAGVMQMDIATADRIPQRLARYAGELTGSTAAERLMLANIAAQDVFGVRGCATDTAALALRALADGRLLGEEPDTPSYFMAVHALTFAGLPNLAERMLDGAIDDARRRGSLFGFAIASAVRSFARLRRGALMAAEADAQAAFDVVHTDGGAGLTPLVLAFGLPAFCERADISACEALLAQTGTDGALPPQTICNGILHARGELHLRAGNADRALADFSDLLARDQSWGMINPAVWPTRSSKALAHVQVGELDEAHRLAAEELDIARRWGASATIAVSLRALAACADGDEGVDLLRTAVELTAGCESRLEHARSLVELGVAVRRVGHPRDARAPLREGLDLAHRCGATRLADHAHGELLAAGARPRRPVLSGADALTAGERRVASAAASGLTNAEIAQGLFVTARTVETHLSRVYQKLRIGSRSELASALGPETDELAQIGDHGRRDCSR